MARAWEVTDVALGALAREQEPTSRHHEAGSAAAHPMRHRGDLASDQSLTAGGVLTSQANVCAARRRNKTAIERRSRNRCADVVFVRSGGIDAMTVVVIVDALEEGLVRRALFVAQ